MLKILVEDYEKIHPDFNSANPPSRGQVIALRSWIEKSLKTIWNDQNFNKKNKFFLADEVFNIGFSELIR